MSNQNCILCFYQYNNNKKIPKILKCGHTFCLECLKRIYIKNDGNFKCPTCRKECTEKPENLTTVFSLLHSEDPESTSESNTITESEAITESSSELVYKIGLIGDPSTGKTCIIKRFVDDEFDENTGITIGLDFKSKTIKLRNHIVNLHITDTAGSEKFNALTTNYLRQLDGIFLVFAVNNVNSFNSIPYWLDFCKNVVDKNKVLFLLGNKTDEEKKISYEQIREFADKNNMRYYHTSALNGDNIKDAFYDMAKKIYQNNKRNKRNQVDQINQMNQKNQINQGNQGNRIYQRNEPITLKRDECVKKSSCC